MDKFEPQKTEQKEKASIHERSKHRALYDFVALVDTHPPLHPFVTENPYGDLSIDYADPQGVLALNTALLKHFYGMQYWDIPKNYLCPPVPGRAEYVHHMADLLAASYKGKVPEGPKIRCLDLGVGANCIYPIVGSQQYGWSFVGVDIDQVALANAKKLVESNPVLHGKLELRHQKNPKSVLKGIIERREEFEVAFCNPPFFASEREAEEVAIRKAKNLGLKKPGKGLRNFGGAPHELWCDGGELGFIQNYIRQSKQFPTAVFWYSTLVSKQANLKGIYNALRQAKAVQVKTIPMAHGNKMSRIVAWTFLRMG